MISYLTAWPSRDLIIAAHQQITRDWWKLRRREFDVFVSQLVVDECQAGDPSAAADRLEKIQDIPLLEQTEAATKLGKVLLQRIPLPDKAAVDALHIAISAIHGLDYLLTWNCAHIANASLRGRIEAACRENGNTAPIICTPDQLMS